MKQVQLIHWKPEEAKPRVEGLRAAGYEVAYEVFGGPASLRELRNTPPDAIVIDLTRLPSHGRDVAMAIRQYKATRHVPLVFAGGEPEKVERLRKLLPDAVFTEWSRIRSSLKQAIAHPPADPVKPESVLAGYSGTPLPKKLGIKAGSVVELAGAPADFRQTLGELPAGVVLREPAGEGAELILWFVRSRQELDRGMKPMAARVVKCLWIIWPKKTSGLAADLSQQDVRETGMAAGLVDYKICAVDATWSGLAFARRKR